MSDLDGTVIDAHDITKRFGKVQALAGLDLVGPPARSSPCSAPTAPARPRSCARSPPSCGPTAARCASPVIDAIRKPEQVRRVIGLAGQYAAVEEAMTGRENLEMVARLFGLNGRAGQGQRRRRARPAGLDEAADRLVRTLLRRHAPQARPRRQPGRRAPPAAARRADHRSRPAQPHRAVGRHPRPGRQGTDVLLTTQYLDEADQLADRIVIVDKGRVIADGTPERAQVAGPAAT